MLRVKQRGREHLRGVGSNGERSAMLALVLAVIFSIDDEQADLVAGLVAASLHFEFLALLERAFERCNDARDQVVAGGRAIRSPSDDGSSYATTSKSRNVGAAGEHGRGATAWDGWGARS